LFLGYNFIMRTTTIFTITAVALLLSPFDVFALSLNPVNSLVGGRKITTIPCLCSPGTLMITVGPPRGGTFIYVPGISRLYRFYSLWPPSWSLGLASGNRTCYQPTPTQCPCCPGIPVGNGPIIRMMGTSLF